METLALDVDTLPLGRYRMTVAVHTTAAPQPTSRSIEFTVVE